MPIMTTVDREQLITLLADRTDMDRDRVDQQLTELAGHIQQAEAKQEGFTIEGLGTFKAVQDRLEFIPSDILSTEINNKYAGMKPIELIGAFKEPAGKDIPVADLPDEQQEPQELEKVPEEQAEAHDSNVTEEKISEPAPPSADISDEEPVVEPEEAAPEGEQEEIQKTEEPAVPVARKEKAKATTSAAGESLSEDPLGKAIVIILVILTLAIAGWLAYDLGLFGSDDAENSPSSSESPAEQQSLNQQSTTTLEAIPATDAEIVENPVGGSGQPDGEGNEMPSTSVETAAYGLYGEPNENLGSGFYTIIVHSLHTMDLAEEKQQELVDEGFRTKINEADVSESTYYRVGIGQFSTIKAAQEAVRELPEPYRSNNFINRF